MRLEPIGRPALPRVNTMPRSMRIPISSHSSTKSRIVQRWMLGVSYQASGQCRRSPACGRARAGCQRTRQWPKFGKRHDRAPADAQQLAAARSRGSRVACRVWLRIDVVEGVGRVVDRGRCRRRPGSPTGPRATQAFTPAWLSSMPRPSTCLAGRQIVEQRAVAAADVEHARARRDHVGDQRRSTRMARRRDGSRHRRHRRPWPPARALGAAVEEAAQRVANIPARRAGRRRGPCRSRSRRS